MIKGYFPPGEKRQGYVPTADVFSNCTIESENIVAKP
jgi:hypothetical protein